MDIRERQPQKEVKARDASPKGKGQHRTVKAAGRQLTAKGREALVNSFALPCADYIMAGVVEALAG